MKTALVPMLLAALIAGCASAPKSNNLAATDTNAKTLAATRVGCVNDTGSRIQRKSKECLGPGRTFTQDDLQRTGEFQVSDALRKLDPSIQ